VCCANISEPPERARGIGPNGSAPLAPDLPASGWPEPLGIIGAGAVGCALAQALSAADVALAGIGTRDPTRATQLVNPTLITTPTAVVNAARLIFLAVPDGVIASVAREHRWRADQWVVHCAGSQPAASLSAAVAPAQAGAFHPLASFARPQPGLPLSPDVFARHVIALDGAPALVSGLTALAERLGARPLVVPPAARAAYHLAASLASNALVALISDAVAVWQSAALDPDLALPALLPLVASTQANLERVGLPAALTGPIARGDTATVHQHLAALDAAPDLAPIAVTYRSLGLQAVALARAQGHANGAALDAIERMLESG
jgi:predicted short-subunit dehydrogenase-like oxidoreductase (DUF2520 family)